MKYLLKNGTVVSGDKSEKLDVLVDGEKIVNVGKDLEAGDAEVKASVSGIYRRSYTF